MVGRSNGYYQGIAGIDLQQIDPIADPDRDGPSLSAILDQLCIDATELATLASESLEAVQEARRNMRSILYAMEEPNGDTEEGV